MPSSLQISVRHLAEFVHRRGDLFVTLDSKTTPEEGVATQQRIQAQRNGCYCPEVAVSQQFVVNGLNIQVKGRVDGWLPPTVCSTSATTETVLVEEFKTTRADPKLAHAHLGSVNLAQLNLYAALLACVHPNLINWQLRLLYCHPQTLEVTPIETAWQRRTLISFLHSTLEIYATRQLAHNVYCDERNRFLEQLPFVHEEYRKHQRAMVKRVYRTLRERHGLLLEAATGSGKSAGVLFPAAKALAPDSQDAHQARFLFLTSRNTGALTALDTLRRIKNNNGKLRYVHIIAKAKVCLVEGMPCGPTHCEYARGYYDRVWAGVDALCTRGDATVEAVREVALTHKLCPFELALDAAVWADFVIADYNYVFDPVVRLLRFAHGRDIGLLIDEAHQLAPRVKDMLSVRVARGVLKAAIQEVAPVFEASQLLKQLRGCDRALLELRRRHANLAKSPSVQTALTQCVIPEPEALTRSLQRGMETVAESGLDLSRFVHLRTWVFETIRWLRIIPLVSESASLFRLSCQESSIEVDRVCLDASEHIRSVINNFAGHVRFSGSVSPLALFQRLHGLDDTDAERVTSSYREDQLGVFIVDDIATYWQRRQTSIDALVQAVCRVQHAHPGRYLLAFPSFDYLHLFEQHYQTTSPQGAFVSQQRHMNDSERTLFLDAIADTTTPLLVGVVLGGVFAESVDFAHMPLDGVVCVSVGLPPPSMEADATADYYQGAVDNTQHPSSADTDLITRYQPAMTKILQIAGRVLRSPEDRGILVLVDHRFCEPNYQQFFPAFWQPKRIRAASLGKSVAKFWQGD